MLLSAQLMSIEDCYLQPNRIDIWEFPLDIQPEFAEALLNEAEKNRANRYYFPRHKRRFTVARAMLRQILGHYLQQEASQLGFSYNKQGKPGLEQAQGLEFNLSHSGELALLAVGQRHPLGIDLEFFSGRPFHGIARHSFSPYECQQLFSLPACLQPLTFFHIWAQKEAFIKACGLGLAYPTKEFDVSVELPAQKLILDKLHQKQWQMLSFMPRVHCNAALCHHPEIKEIRYLKLSDLNCFGSKGRLPI